MVGLRSTLNSNELWRPFKSHYDLEYASTFAGIFRLVLLFREIVSKQGLGKLCFLIREKRKTYPSV